MENELEMVIRLVLAAVLGAVVGVQRESAGKSAGIRTLALISLGAALFTVVSIFAFDAADPARIAANVVTGIGFLGAGTIMRRGEGVIEGMTTAATIWAVAAIGIAAGAGMYLIAIATAILILLLLILPHTNHKGSNKSESS
ncbi:MAG: MgtC/SapB family protein [Dehalogenimonas sp.]|uniref:MgtC/SapB family protein n=1 Tax=Candidatus Dehalogenimonas loeffleri TaxID=3127115 RepID=A0ABZ2J315_9CHLR|nr:MgtC/SapB family protein [Dehalogenimonas sp.]